MMITFIEGFEVLIFQLVVRCYQKNFPLSTLFIGNFPGPDLRISQCITETLDES